MNVSDIKFRCSGLHYLFTKSKSKDEPISKTTQTHLIDIFASFKYKRREEISSKYIEKGNAREEDAITLLSRVTKRFYKKNDIRLTNDYITGEPDLFVGESITNAEETLDTKTCWSLHTFLRAKYSGLDKSYEYQGHGYMALTGAKKHHVCFCLVNSTSEAINDEKRKASYKFGADADLDPKYIAICKQIEINHIFDIKAFVDENPGFDFHNNLSEWNYDIPMADRLHIKTVIRDEAIISDIQSKSDACRVWIERNLMK